MRGLVEARACAVAADLLREATSPIHVEVLARDDLAAFTWPDGHIYLSRGLVMALDDDALAAAIAHEAGHLIVGAPARSAVVGSMTSEPSLESEMRADEIGVQLLKRRGIPSEAMSQMLGTVLRQNRLSASAQSEIRRRILRLETATPDPAANATAPASDSRRVG